MIERHEVEALLTLARELHFGRTAERLHVSTAHVSQTIRKLERRIGSPLFLRTSRRVELTAVGRALVDEIEPAWATITAAVQRAAEAERGLSGILTVAFVDPAGAQLLLGVAQPFRERAPDCEVRIREAQPGGLLSWLRDGEVDLGLGSFPVREPGIVCGPVLVRESLMLAVPVDHPFTRRPGGVSLDDLARVPALRVEGTPDPRTTPSAAPVPQTVATCQEALTLVGAGQGTLLVGAHARRYYPRPDVAYVPVHDAPPLEWGLLWSADRATARVRAYAEAASALVRDLR